MELIERTVFLTNEEMNDFIKLREIEGFKYSHKAKTSGYVSRKIAGYAIQYSGRYGVGYVIHTPRTDTAGFHDVLYLVKPRNYYLSTK